MMRILVTGAAGFLGKHLVGGMAVAGRVTGVQRPSAGRENPESGDTEYAELSDYGQVLSLLERTRPDVVLHSAARIPQSATDDILTFFDDNVRATVNIYQAAVATRVRRIVLSSSMSVYGRPQAQPVGEDHPAVPDAPYALSKIQAELTGRCFAEYGIETTVLRYSGIFGAGQKSGAVPAFIARCLQNAPLTLNAGGRPSSDFVWVRDVVQANLLALQHSPKDNFDVMNIGSGTELTVMKLAEMIRRLCGSTSTIEALEVPSPRDFRFAFDIRKAKDVLGFSPSPIEAALTECIQQKKEGRF